MIKIVEVMFFLKGGTEKRKTYIKTDYGYIPISIIEQIEQINNIISEKEININEKTGLIER